MLSRRTLQLATLVLLLRNFTDQDGPTCAGASEPRLNSLNYVRHKKRAQSPAAADLDAALAVAANPLDHEQQSKRQTVLMSLVEGDSARSHLPIFLNSLKVAGVAAQYIVFALDNSALTACQQMHIASLCVSHFGSTSVNGSEIPVLRDDGGGFGDWLLKGWMKTSIILKTITLGYDCMFLDIDMVAFKNPLLAIDANADVAVTVDCQEEYDPRTSREGGPNLGVLFFKSTQTTIVLVQKWLSHRGYDKWDQEEFRVALNDGVDEYPDLHVQMLKKDQFPVLCCGYCNNLVEPLVSRSWGWRDHCPKEERDKWFVLHACCMNHFREREEIEYDERVQKQDILLMVWDLMKPDHTKEMLDAVMSAR